MKRRASSPLPPRSRRDRDRDRVVGRKRTAAQDGGAPKRQRVGVADAAFTLGAMLAGACRMRAGMHLTTHVFAEGRFLPVSVVADFDASGHGRVAVRGPQRESDFVLYPHTCGDAAHKLHERLVRVLA